MCISRPLKGAFKIQRKRAVPYANQHFGIYLGNVCRRNYLFRYPSLHQNSPVIIRSTAEFHKMLNLHQLSVDYELYQKCAAYLYLRIDEGWIDICWPSAFLCNRVTTYFIILFFVKLCKMI